MARDAAWKRWLGRGARSAAAPADPPPLDFEAAQVRAAREGDRAAFESLHRRHAKMVHGVLLSRVSPQEADDLTQDVFLLALQKLPSLRDEHRFGPWLATIARNRATDHLRQRRPMSELPETLESPRQPRAEAREVLRIIQTLPEAYREPLIMRLVEGMTGPEIAERTGLTPGSVRVNLHRGMKMLRSALGVENKQ